MTDTKNSGSDRSQIEQSIHDIEVAKEDLSEQYHAKMKLAAARNRLEDVLKSREVDTESDRDD